MPPRYLAVPADKLVAEIEAIGEAVMATRGTYGERGIYGEFVQGRERVFRLLPPGRDTEVRIYSSLSVNAEEVRGCGEDAVRIVWGVRLPEVGAAQLGPAARVPAELKPLAASRRINRTATANLPEEARVEAFLGRLRGAIREAYREAVRVPKCPACSAARRSGVLVTRRGSRGPFQGCSAYPQCTFTRDVPREAAR